MFSEKKTLGYNVCIRLSKMSGLGQMVKIQFDLYSSYKTFVPLVQTFLTSIALYDFNKEIHLTLS